MKYVLIIMVFFSGMAFAFGQDSLDLYTDSTTESKFEEQYREAYEKRIRKSHIDGFYIPTDLNDAIRILDEIVDEQGKKKFASQTDTFAVNNVFFSFGRWININWGMEQGSRLTVALNKLGVSYPDDMTRLIMYAWHRHLNNEPLNLDTLVNEVIQERKQREEKVRKQIH